MMDISNVQSLTALVNVIDALTKSDEEAKILSVSISRFGLPVVQLSYEFFIEIFGENELQAPESTKDLVITYVNGDLLYSP